VYTRLNPKLITMRSLTKILLAVILVTACGGAFAKSIATTSLNTNEIVDRHLSGFNAVNIAGPYDVYITQGPAESVKVDAPSDMMSKILTEVNGGVLKIYSKHEYWNWGFLWGHHKKIRVFVTIKDVTGIHVSGSGDAYFKNGITAGALKLSVSGSGDMTGRLDAKTLECNISGSGDMRLSGRADNSSVSVTGSGDFSAGDLVTITSTVHVAGSGDARINASQRVDASVSGSGDVHYTGGAKSISSHKSGSGDISRF
jgi:hypothetical protein